MIAIKVSTTKFRQLKLATIEVEFWQRSDIAKRQEVDCCQTGCSLFVARKHLIFKAIVIIDNTNPFHPSII